MTDLRTAAQMALDTLDWHIAADAWGHDIAGAAEALRAALAQPEPAAPTVVEPVAWMSPGRERLEFSRADTVYGSHTIPLYATPPRAALTNGEIYTAYIAATNQTLRAVDEKLALAFARAIEAAITGGAAQ